MNRLAAVSLAAGQQSAGQAIDGLNAIKTNGADLDVFVNGMLLTSGTLAEITNSTRDYFISDDAELKFAFALEADDAVQVVKR